MKSSTSLNGRHALDIMKTTAQLKDGHYEIALPWISDPPCLENNRSVAEHQLKLQKQRLLKDKELLTKYRENQVSCDHRSYDFKSTVQYMKHFIHDFTYRENVKSLLQEGYVT